MIISNEYRTEWIEIRKVEEDDFYWNSLHIGIQVKTKHFDSYFQSIWIGIEQIDALIKGLGELDETRKGFVRLEGIMGEAFELKIKAIDKNGHLGVGIRIERGNFQAQEWNDVLQTGFEIDPTSIPRMIVELKKLKMEETGH